MGDGARVVVAGIARAMTQDGIHHHDGTTAVVDGAMGDSRGNADPVGFVFSQCDALEEAILQNDQIDAAAQHHQLVGLMPVAEQLRLF